MKLTVKATEVLEIEGALSLLVRQAIPGKVAVLVTRRLRTVEVVAQPIKDDQKVLAEKYAKKDDQGRPRFEGPGRYQMDDTNGFVHDWEDLGKETRELELEPMSLDMLGDAWRTEASNHAYLPILLKFGILTDPDEKKPAAPSA